MTHGVYGLKIYSAYLSNLWLIWRSWEIWSATYRCTWKTSTLHIISKEQNNKHNNDPWQQGKYFHGNSLARKMT